jgi:TRAP-type mannitol/chloroaromatic compound transport system permease large subunit
MTGRELVSELIQAIVALVLLGPTAFILTYEAMNGHATNVPDILATLDGAIIAFYFRGVAVRSATGAVTAAVIAATTGVKA